MLNKEICKKCIRENYWWYEHDEEEWKEGYLWCPFKEEVPVYTPINEPPHKNCHYLLEQFLYDEMTKNVK